MCKEIYSHVHLPVNVGDSSFMHLYLWHDYVSPGLLYSSESCIHACTLYPRTCLKTSRKTSGIYPWPWDSCVLHTWFPWWGTTVCSMQPCLWILYLYLTLRITDAFPCVGYTASVSISLVSTAPEQLSPSTHAFPACVPMHTCMWRPRKTLGALLYCSPLCSLEIDGSTLVPGAWGPCHMAPTARKQRDGNTDA